MQRNKQREHDQAALERIEALLIDADDDTLVVDCDDLQRAIQYASDEMRSYHDALDERWMLRRSARALLRLAFPALMQQFDQALTADDNGQSCHMVRYKLIQDAINRVDWNDAPDGGRSPCPLCGQGTQAGRGFLMLGLERHLDGWKLPACDVIQAFDCVERDVRRLPRNWR